LPTFIGRIGCARCGAWVCDFVGDPRAKRDHAIHAVRFVNRTSAPRSSYVTPTSA
jgi:hypothetical protein